MDNSLLWTVPAEPQFSLRKDNSHVACELRDHGQYGVDTQFFQNGELLYRRRFETRDLALQWVVLERWELVREGWTGETARSETQ